MRIYLPTTLPALAEARRAGRFAADAGLTCHAVTAAVREWYVSGDAEELEFSALTDAAESSLRLIAEHPGSPPRRVVVAVDVPEAAVAAAGQGRSTVQVAGEVALAWVASVHVDEPEAGPTIEAAMAALPAADHGDDDALFLLDEAQACDLLWFDACELEHLT